MYACLSTVCMYYVCLSLCLSLFAYLCVYMFACLYVSMSACLYVCLSASPYISACPYVCLTICMYTSACMYACLVVSMYVSASYTCLLARMSARLYVYMTASCVSVCYCSCYLSMYTCLSDYIVHMHLFPTIFMCMSAWQTVCLPIGHYSKSTCLPDCQYVCSTPSYCQV